MLIEICPIQIVAESSKETIVNNSNATMQKQRKAEEPNRHGANLVIALVFTAIACMLSWMDLQVVKDKPMSFTPTHNQLITTVVMNLD